MKAIANLLLTQFILPWMEFWLYWLITSLTYHSLFNMENAFIKEQNIYFTIFIVIWGYITV